MFFFNCFRYNGATLVISYLEATSLNLYIGDEVALDFKKFSVKEFLTSFSEIAFAISLVLITLDP